MRRKLKTNRVGAVQIASNMYIAQKYGTVLLYSYETPVAGEDHNGKFRTDKHYSSTTTRHINKWLDGVLAKEQPQEYFDSLCAGF